MPFQARFIDNNNFNALGELVIASYLNVNAVVTTDVL